MSEAKYEELIIPIGEMLPGDEVLSSSGEWIKARLLPVQTKRMYRVLTSVGTVDCSFDHQWRLIEKRPLQRDAAALQDDLNRFFADDTDAGIAKKISDGFKEYTAKHGSVEEYEEGAIVLSTVEIFNNKEKYIGWDIGLKGSGVELVGVEMLEEEKCRCLEVDADDHQFVILAERGENSSIGVGANTLDNIEISGGASGVGKVSEKRLCPVLTRNCLGRIVAGRASSGVASQMMLGDSSALAIPSRKGTGIVAMNGEKVHLQYYFAEENPSAGKSWLTDWYRDHGMDKLGFPVGESGEIDPNDVSLGDDMEEFSLSDSDQHFEFEDTTKDIINRKDQHFEEV